MAPRTSSEVVKAIELIKGGMSAYEASKSVGIALSTIYRSKLYKEHALKTASQRYYLDALAEARAKSKPGPMSKAEKEDANEHFRYHRQLDKEPSKVFYVSFEIPIAVTCKTEEQAMNIAYRELMRQFSEGENEMNVKFITEDKFNSRQVKATAESRHS